MNVEIVPITGDEISFAFRVKKAAIGPHVFKKWGWDEEMQKQFHQKRWDEKPFFKIFRDSKEAGVVSIADSGEHIQFGEFYLFPEFHGQGIGTNVLKQVIKTADDKSIPILSEYLKWSPVASLYKRHDFEVIDENDTHYYIKREPKKT